MSFPIRKTQIRSKFNSDKTVFEVVYFVYGNKGNTEKYFIIEIIRICPVLYWKMLLASKKLRL